MKLRQLARLATLCLGAFGTLGATLPAGAQQFPDKPIGIIVPYPPGGSADSIARQLGVHFTQSLKQQVVVENKPGGNSVIAAQTVAGAPADAYTLLISDPTALSINPSLFEKLPYDPVKDFAPVSLVARFTFVLMVNGNSPIHNVKAHVPYKGAAPAVSDLMAGQIDAIFTDLASGMPFIQSGKVRALVVTNAQRVGTLPDVPTVAESGFPSFQLSGWYGIAAPKNTPAPVLATLNAAIRTAVASPALNAWIVSQNFEPRTTTPVEYTELIRESNSQWVTTIKRPGIKMD